MKKQEEARLKQKENKKKKKIEAMEEEKLSKSSKEFQTIQKEQRDKKIEDRIVKACKAIEQSAIPKFKREMIAFENTIQTRQKNENHENKQHQDGTEYMPSSPQQVASPESHNRNDGEIQGTFPEQVENPGIGENKPEKDDDILNKTENSQLLE